MNRTHRLSSSRCWARTKQKAVKSSKTLDNPTFRDRTISQQVQSLSIAKISAQKRESGNVWDCVDGRKKEFNFVSICLCGESFTEHDSEGYIQEKETIKILSRHVRICDFSKSYCELFQGSSCWACRESTGVCVDDLGDHLLECKEIYKLSRGRNIEKTRKMLRTLKYNVLVEQKRLEIQEQQQHKSYDNEETLKEKQNEKKEKELLESFIKNLSPLDIQKENEKMNFLNYKNEKLLNNLNILSLPGFKPIPPPDIKKVERIQHPKNEVESQMRLQNMNNGDKFLKGDNVCKWCVENGMVGYWEFAGDNDKRELYSELVFRCSNVNCPKKRTSYQSSKKVTLSPSKTGLKRMVTRPWINIQATMGASEAGLTNRGQSVYHSVIGLSGQNHKTFRRNQSGIIGDAVEKASKKSMNNALEEEKEMEIKSGNATYDKYGNIGLDGSEDGFWQSRGSGRGHRSKSGGNNMHGRHTKKIIDHRCYSTQCQQCYYNEKRGVDVPHKCYKNHTGSSGSMGPRAVVEMINGAKERRFHYKNIIGDLDSTVMSEVRKKCEDGDKIGRMADKGHWKKTIGRCTSDVKEARYKAEKKILTEEQQKKLCTYIMVVINTNQGNKENMTTDLESLKGHLFFDHVKCRAEKCKWKTITKEVEMKEPHYLRFGGGQLKADVSYVIDTVLLNIDQVVNLGSSNYNEFGHGTISHICLKGLHHAKSRKYQVLIKIGITRINDGMDSVITLGRDELNIPGDQFNTYGIKKLVKEEKRRKKHRSKDSVKKAAAMNKNKWIKSNVGASMKHTGVYQSHVGLMRLDGVIPRSELMEDPSKTFKFTMEKETENFKKFSEEFHLTQCESSIARRVGFGDTETTSFSPGTGGIIQISHQFFHQTEPLSSFCNPNKKWSPGSKKLHERNGLFPSDCRIMNALSSETVCEEYEKLIVKFSGDQAILIFKNFSFDKRFLEQTSNGKFKGKSIIWLEAQKFMILIPRDISDSDSLEDIYLFNNGMKKLSGAHLADADTKGTKELCIVGCGSTSDFLFVTKGYSDAVVRNNGVTSGAGCKSCYKSICKGCKCATSKHKCGIWCSCKGLCSNVSDKMKDIIDYRTKKQLEFRNVYEEIVASKPVLKFTPPKPKKPPKPKPKKPTKPKKRGKKRIRKKRVIKAKKKKLKNNEGKPVLVGVSSVEESVSGSSVEESVSGLSVEEFVSGLSVEEFVSGSSVEESSVSGSSVEESSVSGSLVSGSSVEESSVSGSSIEESVSVVGQVENAFPNINFDTFVEEEWILGVDEINSELLSTL